ncbi:MAG: ABC transporter permease [Acidimicrobiales bacterium]
MSTLALVGAHVRSANRAFWRNPASAFFTLALPVMFLVLFSVLFGTAPTSVGGRSVSSATFTLAGIDTFSVIGACYTNLAIGVTFAREGGFLKRLRGTPLPPWVYLAARIVHAVAVAGLLVVVSVAFSAVAYGVRVPWDSVPALAVSLAVGAASFSALGLAVTALIPNADASPAIVNAVVFPLLFVSNVFIPIARAPAVLRVITNAFPVGRLAQALHQALFPGPRQAALPTVPLLVLAAWGVAGAVVALKCFSWEPRHQPG